MKADRGLKTSDGYPVEIGGIYWDYNFRASKVLGVSAVYYDSDGTPCTWWKTTGGLFDGDRLRLRDEGKLASDVYVEKGIDND